jgi:hypothetical protein
MSLALWAALALTGSSSVQVRLVFKPTNFQIGVHAFELAPGRRFPLWQMGSARDRKDLPTGKELADLAISVDPGSARRFLLAFENPGDEPIHFFAAPHGVAPAENALGFKFKCLCVNHAFLIPAHGWWYRVVEVRMSEGTSGTLTVEHNLFRVSAAKAKAFEGAPAERTGHFDQD